MGVGGLSSGMLNVTIDADLLRGMLDSGAFDRVVRNAAELTLDWVKDWYTALPPDYFDNPEPFPDGTSRREGARSFMLPLGSSWFVEHEDGNTFSVFFKNNRDDGSPWGLRLQHYGGDIMPKNAAALTIPVTADARNRSAAEFQMDFQRELFVVGRDDEDNEGTLCWRDDQGQLHAAYLLRKKSTVPPLEERRGHPALPPDADLGAAFRERLNEALDLELNF